MWHTQQASVIGSSHLACGFPCQDRIQVLTENGVTSMALSDGAGSARLSQEGATLAVEIACQVLCQQFDVLSTRATPLAMKQAILTPVLARIRERAAALSVPSRELACTLLAVAVRGNQYLLFHVGDGVIAYRKGGHLRVASAPENGEFANTTTFVTSRDAMLKSRVVKGSSPDLEGFLLMCDGCEAALYDKRRRRVGPLGQHLFQRAELLDRAVSQDQLTEVLSTVIAERTQDDCTLGLLTRKTETFGHWNVLTQRRQAEILGIATQNANRRRRQLRRYAKAYGVTQG